MLLAWSGRRAISWPNLHIKERQTRSGRRCVRGEKRWFCVANASQFRPARKEDLRKIQQLVLQEYMNPLGLDEKRFLVATNLQGQLTAFGQLEPKPDPDRLQFHELRTLIVSKDARGQGLGTKLMKALVDQAGSVPVYLTTLRNTIPFYAQAGFHEVPLSQAPRSMWFEAAAGTLVARLAVNDQLVVLCNQDVHRK
ncbi:hypothetical protein WJX84_004240 [Apatococcus fuscideae]|uniref:N-acetyltransferase domain-containing protein n=1 Tax=Apatococcus fuscideae TaxID=2026836 RepID=A0AAW1T5H9_9CHLO